LNFPETPSGEGSIYHLVLWTGRLCSHQNFDSMRWEKWEVFKAKEREVVEV